MKTRILLILMVIITAAGFIVGNNQTGQPIAQATEFTQQTADGSSTLRVTRNDGHQNLPIECKTCHACDFPTKRDPCLIMCPRNQIITIKHSPEEVIVVLNEKGVRYGKVVFSHLLHAQMADFSTGCDGCHHYNTARPIERCEVCHDHSRKRKDLSRTDLKGAYHRQWIHSNDCSYCHLPKDQDMEEDITAKIEALRGKSHPEYDAQPKIVYDTDYLEGRIVTFYHDEHVKVFGISCQTCHKNNNCMKCHDVDITYDKPRKHDLKDKFHEEVHKYCNACHADHSCSKCHLSEVKERFDHRVATGFDLAPYHNKVSCDKCHKRTNSMDKPSRNCVACHSNFVAGKFKHERVGFRLDDLHRDLDCESCHHNNNFTITPTYNDCHDDLTYPKHKPGRAVKR